MSYPPEKLWKDTSYFYMKIRDNPKLHPNNNHLIDTFFSKHSRHPNIQWKSWTHPVYYADADTPMYLVYEENSGLNLEIPFPDPYPIGIPAEADAACSIIDRARGVVWHLSKVRPQNGTYVVYDSSTFPIGGSGHNTPKGKWLAGGSGITKLAYLIRPEEIEAGVIRHPLGCATTTHGLGKNYSMATAFVYPPAAHTDKENGVLEGDVIPEGARIQLDPSIDIDTLGLSRTGKIIAKCMQEYGMVVVENGGSWHIYAEHDLTAGWNPPEMSGGLLSPLDNLPNSAWRVIDYDLYPTIDDLSEFEFTQPTPPTRAGFNLAALAVIFVLIVALMAFSRGEK